MSAYHCALAWLPGGRVGSDVRVEVAGDRIVAVTEDAPAAPGDERLAGLVLPGLANVHSHAFHRGLRGRTHDSAGGSFWTWREQMYALAGRLDPESYHRLATAVFAEMALAGITCVGEFHYLHHGAGGAAYADPNAMGVALVEAARAAGIRIALLDTCYLAGGIGRPLEGAQLRFGDGDADRWAQRAEALAAYSAAWLTAACVDVLAGHDPDRVRHWVEHYAGQVKRMGYSEIDRKFEEYVNSGTKSL